VFSGTNNASSGNQIVGNSFKGWSATYLSNFSLGSGTPVTLNDSINGTSDANNATA
jgi:hypothetical protein